MKVSTLIIDADILLYRAGFATEKMVYDLINKRSGTKERFRYKKEVNARIEELGLGPTEYLIVKERDLEPLENCLHILKTMIHTILDEVKPEAYELILSDPDYNFRKDISQTTEYKGNRVQPKPTYMEEMKEYLINQWGALVTSNIEADDYIGITQCELLNEGDTGCCICTIDKDLDMIPGLHYNFVTGEFYEMDQFDSLMCFYSQVLRGDSTDNIMGIPGVGEKTARAILADAKTEEELYKATLQAYANYVASLEEYKGCSDEELVSIARVLLCETAQLVWILRERLNEDYSNLWNKHYEVQIEIRGEDSRGVKET